MVTILMEILGERQAQTVSFCARPVSPDHGLVQARLARVKKAVATARWYAPATLWQVTYERQESLQNIADLYFNIEINIRNSLRALLSFLARCRIHVCLEPNVPWTDVCQWVCTHTL